VPADDVTTTTTTTPTTLAELPTPLLVLDLRALDRNIDAMAQVRPAAALRPHVKAFKSTAMARHVRDRAGHRSFCCATLREMEGMVAAGLDEDLLLANETLDRERLARLVRRSGGRVTVAIDSPETIAAASGTGAEVLIDVDVGLPRCGCRPEDAGRLAELARSRGLIVRGVMGYEGHTVGDPDRERRREAVERSMEALRLAHDAVGGGIASAGGTGTYDLHDWADEVQAGSYLLMDTHYALLDLPFVQAVTVEATVTSVSPRRGWAVVDAGLKAFGMDHGNPTVEGWEVFFCSDEHTTLLADPEGALPAVGDRLRMAPAHIDPTVAYHEQFVVARNDEILETWPVDLRGW
jgi:D-threonine aldolase